MWGLPRWLSVKNLPLYAGDPGDASLILGSGTSGGGNGKPLQYSWKIPRTEEPGGLYSPWGYKESDTTEHTHTLKCGDPHGKISQ